MLRSDLLYILKGEKYALLVNKFKHTIKWLCRAGYSYGASRYPYADYNWCLRSLDSKEVHICTLKPFTQEYRSEHSSRGRAKLNVQKQCRANHSEMFCEEKDIVCKTYD
ncbi:hypothetical protein NDCJBJIB_00890 [Mannheimia haemolytica]